MSEKSLTVFSFGVVVGLFLALFLRGGYGRKG